MRVHYPPHNGRTTPMISVYASHLGNHVRVGGCKVDHIHLRHALTMKHIARRSDVDVPAATSFSAASNLRSLLSTLFLNNGLGDCVVAARARRIGLLTGNTADAPFQYTDAMLYAEYGRIGGYVVGAPATDNGCDPTVSADDGVVNGYADGSRDAGWVSVDASDWRQVMLANWISNGACDLSMALPTSWLNDAMPAKNGDVWDVAGEPVPENGHNVAVVDHDAEKGLLVDTWGLLVWVTPAAVAKYGARSSNGMLIAHVNHDAIARSTDKAPDGFDWDALLAYFGHELGGHVAPDRVTADPPVSGPVTLAMAKTWAANGCASGPVLMSRASAARHAQAGLASEWPVT